MPNDINKFEASLPKVKVQIHLLQLNKVKAMVYTPKQESISGTTVQILCVTVSDYVPLSRKKQFLSQRYFHLFNKYLEKSLCSNNCIIRYCIIVCIDKECRVSNYMHAFKM